MSLYQLEPRLQRFYFLPFITATPGHKGGNAGGADDLLRDHGHESLQSNRLNQAQAADRQPDRWSFML